MSALSRQIAARFMIAMDKAIALKVADAIREMINAGVPGINWHWDARKEDLNLGFGWSGKGVSFPGKPAELTNKGILGGLLVKGEFATEPVRGQANTIKLEIGYYHKLPGGEGQYSYETDLGTYDVTIDAQGSVDFSKDEESGEAQDTSRIQAGAKELVQHIETHPPAVSQSKGWKKKREKQQQTEKLRQKGEEQLEQEKAELAGPYSSVEAFFNRMSEIDPQKGEFGPPDLQKLLQGMYKSPAEREANRASLLQQLKDTGLTFNPGKKTLSSVRPSFIANELVKIANAIDSARQPSASRVAAAIRNLYELL